jgi:hypothetical protein
VHFTSTSAIYLPFVDRDGRLDGATTGDEMTARLARIVALSAAFLSLPALARTTHTTKHHPTHHSTKHARAAAKTHHKAKPVEVAKADPEPAPAAAEHPAYQSDDPEAAPSGSRRVVTHSIYSASAE